MFKLKKREKDNQMASSNPLEGIFKKGINV